MEKLAIVIPAYKSDFLKETLASLASQTYHGFTVYICDDKSPYDIYSIVMEFENSIDIKYIKFDENLGATNLIGQWTRCIQQVDNEDWIWLFSDDDIMEPECVELFMSSDKAGHDVIHFDIDIIDSDNNIIRHCNPYPAVLSSADFYKLLYSHRIDARMPEFVFRSDILKINGFVPFDLAWRSDNATVMLNSLEKGILTLSGNNSKVLWRASESNISSICNNRERKNAATVDFFNWTYSFFQENGIRFPLNVIYQLKTFLFELIYKDRATFTRESIIAGRSLKYVKLWLWPLYIALIGYRILYRQYDLKQD